MTTLKNNQEIYLYKTSSIQRRIAQPGCDISQRLLIESKSDTTEKKTLNKNFTNNQKNYSINT
jgi:hypothetical protein